MGRGRASDYSRIDELQKLLLSRQQRELDLDDRDLRRPLKWQILEQPHGHRVLQRLQVLRTPCARDGATVHARLSVRALLRDEQRDVWREREREATFYGHRWAEHATDEDNPSGCVRFTGGSCGAWKLR